LAVSFIYFVELIFASTVIIFFIGNAMDHVRIKKRGHSSPRKHGQSSEGNPKQLIDRYLQRSDVRIKRDRPEVILYAAGPVGVGYQTNMWLPVLERLGVSVGIVIRDLHIYGELKSTGLPIYYFRTLRDLECMEEVGVKTLLYPGNSMKNAQSFRLLRLNHFFINHGESDKVVNQSKFLRAYDKLLVAGEFAEKRLKDAGLRFHDDQIVHVGRPQVELSLERIEVPRESIATILYAPTWEGFAEEANYSSVNSFGYQMLQELISSGRYTILYKPHPFTGHNKDSAAAVYKVKFQELAESSEFVTFFGSDTDIHSLMNMSDLMLTDVSSVLNDYLYSRKPMILTNPHCQSRDEFYSTFLTSRAAYLLDPADDVVCKVKEIENNDDLWEQREEICVQSLGDFPEGSLARFNRVVCDSVQ